MPKFIKNHQITGTLGENFIKGLVLKMGYVFETIQTDAGLDGTIELRDPTTGEMLNLILRAQVKSTEHFQSESDTELSFTCSEDDIEYWLKGNTPNILIVCNPRLERAYWKNIQSYFSGKNRDRRTVRFNKSEDVFDESCAGILFEISRPDDSGLYMEAPHKSEVLTTNLLKIKTLPQDIFIAPTECKSLKEVYARAYENGADLSPEVLLHSNMLVSVYDFRKNPIWNLVCESNASEKLGLWEYFDIYSEPERYLLAQLLKKCMKGFGQTCELRYAYRDDMFYFGYVKGDGSAQKNSFHGRKNKTLRKVVSPLGGRAKGYRHYAFIADFHFIEQEWYMQVSPTYYYTWNGYRRKDNSEEFLSKIKRMDRNKAVFSQLRLWEEYLCNAGSGDLLSDGYPHLSFGSLEYVELNRSVPDNLWQKSSAVDATIEKGGSL